MAVGLWLVYFGYGLAFWAMGLGVLLESGRVASQANAVSLHWLSAFGLLHGTHEWLEAYLLVTGSSDAGSPAWLGWLRLGLLTLSFGCLLGYAVTSLIHVPPARQGQHWRYVVAVFTALLALMLIGTLRAPASVDGRTLIDIAARYLLAVPAALLAAMALWSAASNDVVRASENITRNFRLAAAGFAAYSFTQLFVHRQPWFPAAVLNQETILALTHIPIQAVRGALAAVIAFALLRAMQAAEESRQADLASAQRERLAAIQEQDALRRDLLRHVVRSQEDERARIARELHDEIAQFLSAFSLHLATLRSQLRQKDSMQMVERLEDLTRQMSQSLYRLVRDLRPSHLDNLGLVPAIKYLLSQEYGPRGLDVRFNVSGRAQPMEGPIDTALFRIVQEALNNVMRHAGVHEAELELHYDPAGVTLRICDRGRGFNPEEPFRPPRGWGLAGMRERVDWLGGKLTVRSAATEGTVVEVTVPLADGAQTERAR